MDRNRMSGYNAERPGIESSGGQQSYTNQLNNDEYFRYAEEHLPKELLPILYSMQNPVKMDTEWYADMVNWFGGQTNAQKFNLQQDDKFRQGITDLFKLNYQNNYNSPQNQAELERQAGLNPDLLGNISAQPSADADITQGATDTSAFAGPSSPIEVISNVTSVFLQAYDFAAGMISKGVDIYDKISSLQDKDFARGLSALGLAPELAPYTSSDGQFPDFIQFDKKSGDFKLKFPVEATTDDKSIMEGQDVPQWVFRVFRSPFKDKRNSRRLVKALNNMIGSRKYKSGVYKDNSDFFKSRVESTAWEGSDFGDFGKKFSEVMQPYITFFQKTLSDSFKVQSKRNDYDLSYYGSASGSQKGAAENSSYAAAVSKGQYDSSYYGSLNGATIAEQENASAENTKEMAEFQKNLNSVTRDVINSLAKKSRDGDGFSTFMLMFLSFMSTNGAALLK